MNTIALGAGLSIRPLQIKRMMTPASKLTTQSSQSIRPSTQQKTVKRKIRPSSLAKDSLSVQKHLTFKDIEYKPDEESYLEIRKISQHLAPLNGYFSSYMASPTYPKNKTTFVVSTYKAAQAKNGRNIFSETNAAIRSQIKIRTKNFRYKSPQFESPFQITGKTIEPQQKVISPPASRPVTRLLNR